MPLTTHLPRWLAGPAVAVTLVIVGVAHATSADDLQHRADNAKGRATEALLQEQALAGGIGAQSAQSSTSRS